MVYHTYHCICTELIIAVPSPLAELARREKDSAFICADGPESEQPFELGNVMIAPTATVLKLEDGYEKRYEVTCSRCELMVGYQLDLSSFEDTKTAIGEKKEVIYLLPGGLQSTKEMQEGKSMEKEVQLVASGVA